MEFVALCIENQDGGDILKSYYSNYEWNFNGHSRVFIVGQHVDIKCWTKFNRLTLIAETKMAPTKPEVVQTRRSCHLGIKCQQLLQD